MGAFYRYNFYIINIEGEKFFLNLNYLKKDPTLSNVTVKIRGKEKKD